MKKIKVGLLGADTVTDGISLALFFKNAELISLFDLNKERLNQAVSYAKENGIYIKAYNNADDFYATEPDMILAGRHMSDYIFCENAFLPDAVSDSLSDGVASQIDGNLHFFNSGSWNPADISLLSSQNQLIYIKNGKNPLFAYFMLKFCV